MKKIYKLNLCMLTLVLTSFSLALNGQKLIESDGSMTADTFHVGNLGYLSSQNGYLGLKSAEHLHIIAGADDTGDQSIFFSSFDHLNIMKIDGGTGRLGLGILTPTEKLHVDGAIRIGTSIGATPGTIRWTGSDFEGFKAGSWHSFTSGGGGLWNSASGDIYFDTGNVGIGNNAPGSTLDVTGNASISYNSTGSFPILKLVEETDNDYCRMFFQNSANLTDRWSIAARTGTATDHDFGWNYNGAPRMVYNETENSLFVNGSIGVGVSSPTASVDIGSTVGAAVSWNSGLTTLRNTVDLLTSGYQDFNILVNNLNAHSDSEFAIYNAVDKSVANTPVVNFNLDGGYSWINTGAIGIGTTTASQKLHVKVTGFDGIRVEGDGTGDARGMWITNTNGSHFIYDDLSDASALKIETANELAFNVGGSERMRILEAGGEVGIGGTDVNARFNVETTNDLYTIYSTSSHTGTTSSVYGLTSSNGGSTKYGIRGQISGTSGSGQSTGIYGFASTTPANFWAVYASGDLWYTGTLKAPSDIRLKKNIENLTPVLDKVLQLETKTYEFDREKYAHANLAKGPQIGFIAQNVQQLFPSLVEEEKHVFEVGTDETTGEPIEESMDILGMSSIEMIPILTKAIQEQQALIKALQIEVENLKSER